VRQAYLLPVMLCIPPVAVLLVMQKMSMAHTYRQLVPQVLVAGLVYAIGLWWAYTTNRALHVGDLGISVAKPATEVAAMIPAGASEREDV
jgi:hypothetical protein